MKKILFIVVLVFPTLLFSQIFNPVTWEFSKKDLGIPRLRLSWANTVAYIILFPSYSSTIVKSTFRKVK